MLISVSLALSHTPAYTARPIVHLSAFLFMSQLLSVLIELLLDGLDGQVRGWLVRSRFSMHI